MVRVLDERSSEKLEPPPGASRALERKSIRARGLCLSSRTSRLESGKRVWMRGRGRESGRKAKKLIKGRRLKV